MITKIYLDYLNEGIKELHQKYFTPERLQVKDYISKNDFIYLYHGTSAKNLELIKVEGLKYKTKYNKTDNGYWLYFSSVKKASLMFSRPEFFSFKTPADFVLLVKLDTKILKFARCWKNFFGLRIMDEYLYDKDIPIKDILLPNDSKYKNIELTSKYLIRF
jgi:hypothetical protein